MESRSTSPVSSSRSSLVVPEDGVAAPTGSSLDSASELTAYEGFCKEHRGDHRQIALAMSGWCISADPDRARSWLEISDSTDNAATNEQLRMALLTGLEPVHPPASAEPSTTTTTTTTVLSHPINTTTPIAPMAQQFYNLGIASFSKGEYTPAEDQFIDAFGLGHADAGSWIGYMYEANDLSDEAINWYLKAIHQGSMIARALYGWWCINHMTTPNKFELGLHYFNEAVRGKSSLACSYLGNLYLKGLGVEQDANMANYWYGQAWALYKQNGPNPVELLKPNLRLAHESEFNELWLQAEAGNSEAHYKLGVWYEGQHDPFKAAQYYFKACAKDHPLAMTRVAELPRERVRALFSFSAEAITSFDPKQIQSYNTMDDAKAFGEAMNNYRLGYYKEAYYVFNMLVERGDAKSRALQKDSHHVFEDSNQYKTDQTIYVGALAKVMLGDMYWEGHGVKQNSSLAARYYSEASSIAVGVAYHRLGKWCLLECDNPHQYTEARDMAIALLEQSKEAGYLFANLDLGIVSARYAGWDFAKETRVLENFSVVVDEHKWGQFKTLQKSNLEVAHLHEDDIQKEFAMGCIDVATQYQPKSPSKAWYWYNCALTLAPWMRKHMPDDVKMPGSEADEERFNKNYPLAHKGDPSAQIEMAFMHLEKKGYTDYNPYIGEAYLAQAKLNSPATNNELYQKYIDAEARFGELCLGIGPADSIWFAPKHLKIAADAGHARAARVLDNYNNPGKWL